MDAYLPSTKRHVFLISGQEGRHSRPDGPLRHPRDGGQRQDPRHGSRGQLPGRNHLHPPRGGRGGGREGGKEDEER